jgi:hypothetical protein
VTVTQPKAYLIPQAWRAVIERLQWNGVQMQRVEKAQVMNADLPLNLCNRVRTRMRASVP